MRSDLPFRSLKHLGRPLALAALYQAFALFWAGMAAWIFALFGGSGPFEFFIIAGNFTGFFIAFCDLEVARNEAQEAGQ